MPTFNNNAVQSPSGAKILSTEAAIERVLESNPMYLDEPIYSEEVARILGITTAALTSMHWRANGSGTVKGPEYTKLGNRRRVYTRRSVFTWLWSHDPAARQYLKRIEKKGMIE